MHELDHEKALYIIDQGLNCYKVMLFSLKNAGITYQRLFHAMFKAHISWIMVVYVDDILVKRRKALD
jgi:hypothetical protein